MSKIGRANLDLQEQAEELGFESVQEALDNHFVAMYCPDGQVKLVSDVEYEMQKAHDKYVAKKTLLIDELEMFVQVVGNTAGKELINEVIEFLKEKEI